MWVVRTKRGMKLTVVILATALALGSARAPRSWLPNFGNGNRNRNRNHIANALKNVDLDLCPACIQFTDETINFMLNFILNVGVLGSCGELCQAVAQKTGSQALGAVCTVLCDIVGIEEFVKLIQKADMDPIYFCELLKTCPINDHGDATIKDLSITPVTGPQGMRSITFTIDSKNGTGTGELDIIVLTVDGMPVEDKLLMQAANASQFPAPQSFSLKAVPDPDCDPTQQFCEQWLPGTYVLRVDICNGECGSKHPHSQLYDRKQTNFTITKN